MAIYLCNFNDQHETAQERAVMNRMVVKNRVLADLYTDNSYIGDNSSVIVNGYVVTYSTSELRDSYTGDVYIQVDVENYEASFVYGTPDIGSQYYNVLVFKGNSDGTYTRLLGDNYSNSAVFRATCGISGGNGIMAKIRGTTAPSMAIPVIATSFRDFYSSNTQAIVQGGANGLGTSYNFNGRWIAMCRYYDVGSRDSSVNAWEYATAFRMGVYTSNRQSYSSNAGTLWNKKCSNYIGDVDSQFSFTNTFLFSSTGGSSTVMPTITFLRSAPHASANQNHFDIHPCGVFTGHMWTKTLPPVPVGEVLNGNWFTLRMVAAY